MTSIRGFLPGRLKEGAAGRTDAAGLERYRHTLGAEPAVERPTPTFNAALPFRRGGFGSLCEALDYAAGGETGLNFFDARGKLLTVLSYAELRSQAQRFGRQLMAAGIGRGERLVIVADTWPGFCIAFFGAQYAGVLPVPVTVPVGLGAKENYIIQLRRQIVAAGAVAVVAPDDLASFAISAAEGTWARIAGALSCFENFPETGAVLQPLGPGERCYIQYSSGSTRTPLGVDIRQDRLMANIDASIARQQLDENDSGVSWLPLYHDMGLIGFVLAPMCAQRSVDLMAPRDFARRPLQWLSMISRRRATITFSPSFGYDLAVRRARTQSLDGIDLSCLKIAGIGADMIQPEVLRRFAETFAPCGFDDRAFLPSYGLAETCVGLSISDRFTGMRTDLVNGREFVSCGRVLDGHRLRILDGDGKQVADRQLGRVFAQGPSVMPGYFLDTAASAEVLDDGWLDTGDLGYLVGDQLTVTGRAKDLIIVNGRNIWPQDIEWAVEALPGLGQGDVCAFSVNDSENEAVIVLVQSGAAGAVEKEALCERVRQAVRQSVGVECEVVPIPRRPGLPMTSSGKLSRSRAREMFVAARQGGGE